MKTVKKIWIISSIALLMACNGDKQIHKKVIIEKKPIKIEVFQTGSLQNKTELNYSGLIIPCANTPLSFQLPGSVAKIHKDIGDAVKKGDVIAEIDKTTYESTFQAALAAQNQAKDAYNRLKTVHENGSLPEIQWEEIKSKLEQANSTMTIANQNLKHCELRAPIDGLIGERKIEIGSTVTPGIAAVNLVTLKDVYIKISVPENEINLFKKNMQADIVINAIGSKIFHATVDKIGIVANQLSKTYEVKLLLENLDYSVKPGMVCDVNIRFDNEQEKIVIPSKAVLRDNNGKNFVYKVITSSKSVSKQYVETGTFQNNNLHILTGLNSGDIVVIGGQHKLHDNMEVRY